MTSFFSHLVPFVSIYPGQKNKKGLLQGFLRLFLLRRCLKKESTKNITIIKFSKNWLDGVFFKLLIWLELMHNMRHFFGIFKHCGLSSLGMAFTFFWICTASQKAVLYMYSAVYEKGRFGWMLKHLAATAHFHKRVRASLFPTRLHAPYRQHRPYDAIERSLISLGLK